MSAVKDPQATTCTFGHNLLRDFAVRYGSGKTRFCRMCELQVTRAAIESEMRKIEDQGRHSWKS